MAFDQKCDGCNNSVNEYTVDIDFEEVTKQAYETARKNAEVIKIEEEGTETMWVCPTCKVYMKLNEAAC